MSINDFIANFGRGARPNKFKVQITWPAVVGTPNVRDEFVVKAAGLPASTIGTILIPYQGRQIPVPGDRTFDNWVITVLNDLSHSHRNAFERWMNALNAHRDNTQATENFRDLTAIIDVTQLGVNGEALKNVKVFNAFPTDVSQIDLGYDNNDVISEFQVTFAYSHWESPGTTN